MKHSLTWFALILIASALLLRGVRSASGEPSGKQNTSKREATSREHATNGGPIATPINQPATEKANNHSSGETYNYNGNFNYTPPPTPPESDWTIAAEIASVASAVLVAMFTALLWHVSRQQKNLMLKAEETSRRSVEVAALALNTERPYVFLEGQQIAVTLCLSGFANMLKHPVPIDVSADPLAYKGVDPRDAAECQLYFELRNRGKGVAVIRNVHIRMLIGKGLEENGARLWTAGRCDGHIRLGVKVLGLGETAHVSSSGLQLNLDQLGIIKAWGASLQFVVLVSYDDVYRRHYSTTFPFEYRPPVPDVIRQGLFSGPLLVPAFKRLRRRYG